MHVYGQKIDMQKQGSVASVPSKWDKATGKHLLLGLEGRLGT